MGDILSAAGLADLLTAQRMVEAWDRLLAELRPRLVVTDYAPFLSLAIFGRWPHLSVGTGFTLPPDHLDGFPRLNGDGLVRSPDVERTFAALLERRRVSVAAPPRVLCGDQSFPCVVPDLDVFASLRRLPAAGPLSPGREPGPPASSSIVAYLSAEAEGCRTVLAGLARSGRTGVVYVRGGDDSHALILQGSSVRWCPEPLRLPEAIQNSGVVVHAGGANTAQQALLGARPQLVFPDYLEQRMNAAELERMGVGQTMSPDDGVAEIAHAVDDMCTSAGHGNDWATTAFQRARFLHDQYRRGCLDTIAAAAWALAT